MTPQEIVDTLREATAVTGKDILGGVSLAAGHCFDRVRETCAAYILEGPSANDPRRAELLAGVRAAVAAREVVFEISNAAYLATGLPPSEVLATAAEYRAVRDAKRLANERRCR